MHIDDLKNPEFRKGRRQSPDIRKSERQPKPALTENEQRQRYAEQVARAEFGRFYWNDRLRRRMERELEKSRRLKREAAERARRKARNGSA